QVNDAERLVDEHARWRLVLERLAMSDGLTLRGGSPADRRRRDVRYRWRKAQSRQRKEPIAPFDRSGEPCFPGRPLEVARRTVGVLRRPQEEEAARFERVVEGVDHLLLQVALEVDQQVAAGDEIEARERGVFEDAVVGEQNDVSQLALDPVELPFADE